MWKNRCNLCGKVSNFLSIDKELRSLFNQHGFPYKLNDFETLNYKKYNCSNCGSSDRDRLYRLYFEKFLPVGKSKTKLLDFAPSRSLQKYLKKRRDIVYRSADLMMDDVDDKIDITNMKQYKDGRFDFFICSHVIEHVSSDKKALNELNRVLRIGGKGIIMTPIIDKPGVHDEDVKVNDPSERWRRFAQGDHVRLYEKQVFLKRVSDAGFKLHELSYRQLGLIKFLQYGISLKSKLYVVVK